jgi:ribonuclease BN (tRNA processing enzyme)
MLKLTVLGNNGPYPAAGGACSGYLLRGAGYNIVIDLGSGALSNLMKALDSDLDSISAIFLTHLHSDHISDISVLRYALDSARKNSRYDRDGSPRKTALFCPPAPELEYDAIRSYAAFEATPICEALEPRLPGLRFAFAAMEHPYLCFAMSVEEIPAGDRQATDAKLRLQPCKGREQAAAPDGRDYCAKRSESAEYAKPVAPVSPAAPAKPAKFVFSGDTSWNQDLIALSQNADLLLIDACLSSAGAAVGGKALAHLTAEECGVIAAEANVKKLLLTHFSPGCDVARRVTEAKMGVQKVLGWSGGIVVEAAEILSSYEISASQSAGS